METSTSMIDEEEPQAVRKLERVREEGKASSLPNLRSKCSHHDTSFLEASPPHISSKVKALSDQPDCFSLEFVLSQLLLASLFSNHEIHQMQTLPSAHRWHHTSKKQSQFQTPKHQHFTRRHCEEMPNRITLRKDSWCS